MTKTLLLFFLSLRCLGNVPLPWRLSSSPAASCAWCQSSVRAASAQNWQHGRKELAHHGCWTAPQVCLLVVNILSITNLCTDVDFVLNCSAADSFTFWPGLFRILMESMRYAKNRISDTFLHVIAQCFACLSHRLGVCLSVRHTLEPYQNGAR